MNLFILSLFTITTDFPIYPESELLSELVDNVLLDTKIHIENLEYNVYYIEFWSKNGEVLTIEEFNNRKKNRYKFDVNSALKEIQRNYWYNDTDMRNLLALYSNNGSHFYVAEIAAFNRNYPDSIILLESILVDTMKEISKSNQLKIAVIPLNIGTSLEDEYQGLHWVGLILKYSETHHFTAYYIDSFAHNINPIIKSKLLEVGIDQVKEYKIKQQDNDCGPITLYNLDHLAFNDTQPFIYTEGVELNVVYYLNDNIKILYLDSCIKWNFSFTYILLSNYIYRYKNLR